MLFRGHGIRAEAAPRVAATKAFRGEPGAAGRAVRLQCFQRVRRAAWLKPAARHGPQNERLGWRQDTAIKTDHSDEHVLDYFHPLSLNNPAFRRLVKKSFSTSAKALPTMEARAIST